MDASQIVELVLALVGIASTIATMTPNKTDDKAVQFVLDLINMLGMNMGKAKNK